MTARPCASCGELIERGAWCEVCAPPPPPDARGTRTERGYDEAWARLSVRARRRQPWCSDCGSDEDLTADHLPGAWERRARGERLTLADVDVVCRACNSRRGATRSVKGPGGSPRRGGVGPAGVAPEAVTPHAASRSVT